MLLTGPRAAEAAPFATVPHHFSHAKGAVSQGLKTVGHKLSNFLARV
jgi:hypothetical protein